MTIFGIMCYTLLYKTPMRKSNMNISLTPELEQFVNTKVNSGMYTSASEVIRESLRLLHTYEDLQTHRIKQLNDAIDVGLTQLNANNKISAKDSYNRLKKKINKLAKETK